MQELLAGSSSASDKRVARDLVYSRASIDEIEAFEAKRHGGPTIQDFRLDLTSKGLVPWNIYAEKIFVAWFKQTRGLQLTEDDEIAKRFHTYVKTISSAYKKTALSPDVLAAHKVWAKHTTRRHEVRQFTRIPGHEADVASSCSNDAE